MRYNFAVICCLLSLLSNANAAKPSAAAQEINQPQRIGASQNLEMPSANPAIIHSQQLDAMSFLAPDADLRLDDVVEAMLRDDWQLAKQRITPLLEDSPDLQTLFLAGQINSRLQDFSAAEQNYRAMLAIDATLVRARFELAQLLFFSDDLEGAQYQFERVQQQQLPTQVRALVEEYLNKISRSKRAISLMVSLVPNDNINQGSQDKTFTYNGKEYTYAPTSRARSSVGIEVNLGAIYRFGANNDWFVRANLQRSDFPASNDDLFYSSIDIGRNLYNNQHYQLKASFGGHYNRYEKKTLYKGITAKVEQRWKISPFWWLDSTMQAQQLDYGKRHESLNGWQYWANLSVNHSLNPQTLLGAQLDLSRRTAKSDDSSNYGIRAGVFAQRDTSFAALTIGADAATMINKYDGEDWFFENRREDKKIKFGVNVLKRDWSYRGFSPRLSFSHTRNSSNIPVYDYNANELYLSVTKDF